MVTEWGMSATMGAVNLAAERRPRFLDMGGGAERGPYSEETAREIDHEVRRIVMQAHDEARRLLEAHRDVLEAVTRRLLEIEVMDGDELRRFFPAPAAKPGAESPAPSSAEPGV